MKAESELVYLFDFDRNLRRYTLDHEAGVLREVEAGKSSGWNPMQLKNYGILKRFINGSVCTFVYRNEKYFKSDEKLLKLSNGIGCEVSVWGPFCFYKISVEGEVFKYLDICIFARLDKFVDPLRDNLDEDASDYCRYLSKYSA